MLSRVIAVPSAALLGLSYLPSHADTTLRYDVGTGKDPNIVMISGDKVRMESTTPQGKAVMIYDDRSKSFIALDSQKKNFVVMDRTSIQQQGQRMQAMQQQMMAQMQERLKQMPEDQRKEMEEKMAQMGIGGASTKPPQPPSFSTKKSTRAETISGVTCVVYESYMGSEKIGDACIASAKTLKLSTADYKTLQGMFAFQRDMQKQFASAAGNPASQNQMGMFDNVDGLPVKVTSHQGGGMTLVGISNQPLAPDIFKIPSDYKQVDPMSAAESAKPGGPQQQAPQRYQPPQGYQR